jgi:hypothetical protein
MWHIFFGEKKSFINLKSHERGLAYAGPSSLAKGYNPLYSS